MGSYYKEIIVLELLTMALMVNVITVSEAVEGLKYDYYKSTCPNVEIIVKKHILPILVADLFASAHFLRIVFHDCQVQGCDASVLIDSETNNAEINSDRNFGIMRRDSIDYIKAILEFQCPGVVSCADIIALAGRDSVCFAGGPCFPIPLGRRDGVTSDNLLADVKLPPPSITVDKFINIFADMGMTIPEAVSILGAHTLGIGHCVNVVERLYSNPKPEENLSEVFKFILKAKCPHPIPIQNLTFLVNDLTPTIFDNQYFKEIVQGRAIFSLDSVMSVDPRTSGIVLEFSQDQNKFFQVFKEAYLKLSSHGVLTGDKGVIRRVCSQLD